MKRFTLFVSLIVVLSVLLSACGGGAPAPTEAQEPEVQEPAPTEPPSTEPPAPEPTEPPARPIPKSEQTHQKLYASEQRYRQLVKYAPAGIYEVDFLNSRFIDVKDVMCEYSGYSREEFLSLSVLDFVTEDCKQLFLERTQKVLAGEPISETAEFKVKRKNGQEFWILINSRIEYDQKIPVRATVVAYDITERKRAEEELEKYRFHLEELVNERTVELSVVDQPTSIGNRRAPAGRDANQDFAQ